jgi:hypothetical protein
MRFTVPCDTCVVANSLQVAPVLDAKAVLLRLTAGTQEAGFLTSFCPIAKFPTVVVIKSVLSSMVLETLS